MTRQRPLPKTALEAVQGVDLSGKVFLVTGAYSGLGAATTAALLSAGAKVIAAGRNAKAQADFATGLTTLKNGATALDASRIDAEHTLDLGSLASVRDFARAIKAKYGAIDGLINNAGIMATPPGVTTDGFEIQMGTNVIGHFLLAKILADITARQVWLSSRGHVLVGTPPAKSAWDYVNAPRIDLNAIKTMDAKTYDPWRRYQQSKLGDILLAKQFPREFAGMIACSVHPGIVMTNLSRHQSTWSKLKWVIPSLLGAIKPVSPEQGARTQTLCAVMPKDELSNGAYYADCAVAKVATAAENMDDAKKLYDYCDQVTRPFQT